MLFIANSTWGGVLMLAAFLAGPTPVQDTNTLRQDTQTAVPAELTSVAQQITQARSYAFEATVKEKANAQSDSMQNRALPEEHSISGKFVLQKPMYLEGDELKAYRQGNQIVYRGGMFDNWQSFNANNASWSPAAGQKNYDSKKDYGSKDGGAGNGGIPDRTKDSSQREQQSQGSQKELAAFAVLPLPHEVLSNLDQKVSTVRQETKEEAKLLVFSENKKVYSCELKPEAMATIFSSTMNGYQGSTTGSIHKHPTRSGEKEDMNSGTSSQSPASSEDHSGHVGILKIIVSEDNNIEKIILALSDKSMTRTLNSETQGDMDSSNNDENKNTNSQAATDLSEKALCYYEFEISNLNEVTLEVPPEVQSMLLGQGSIK